MKVLHTTRTSATVECPTCGAVHTVDRDELGADLETVPCQADDCTKRLCYACQRECSACALPHCEDHLVTYGTERLCPVCMAEAKAQADAAYAEVTHAA